MNFYTIFLIFTNFAAPFWLPMIIPKNSQVKVLKLPDSNTVPLKCLQDPK